MKTTTTIKISFAIAGIAFALAMPQVARATSVQATSVCSMQCELSALMHSMMPSPGPEPISEPTEVISPPIAISPEVTDQVNPDNIDEPEQGSDNNSQPEPTETIFEPATEPASSHKSDGAEEVAYETAQSTKIAIQSPIAPVAMAPAPATELPAVLPRTGSGSAGLAMLGWYAATTALLSGLALARRQ